MLIEIYDYAAKLLNNMTATGTGTQAEAETETETESESETESAPRIDEDINNQSVGTPAETEVPASGGNLTVKLLQATTGNVRTLLNRTLATVTAVARSNPAQHVPFRLPLPLALPLPALLLQALDAADVTRGQHIDHTTQHSASGTVIGAEEAENLLPHVLEAPPPLMAFNATVGPATITNPLSTDRVADRVEDVYSALSGAMPTAGNLSGFIESSTTAARSVLSSALPTLPTLPATTFQAQTVATFISATGGKNRPTTIVLYPTGEYSLKRKTVHLSVHNLFLRNYIILGP